MSDDFLRELYGTAISVYSDAQAIEDDILIPFITTKRDTGHRVTTNAWNALIEYHADRCRNYGDAEFYRFLFAELLPIAPYAIKK